MGEKVIGKEGRVHETAQLSGVYIGNYCEVGAYSMLQNVEMGDYAYCCSNDIFQNVRIGKFANIAAAVRIGATDHPMERPSLHHFTYRSKMYGFSDTDDDLFFAKRAGRMTKIGHDTWIGHGAMVKPGVVVGNGAVVGQGSVVTKDVPPYAVVAGNPAKIIRYRFEPDVIEALEGIQWWHWSYEDLQTHFMDFRGSIEDFIKKHGKKVGK